MTKQLLSSKLFIPPLRPGHLSRPRLIEVLNAGLEKKLTLISAPAGFGKSSLASEWANQVQRPTAWIALDKNDNDLSRFLAYLSAALRSIGLVIGDLLLDSQPALTDLDLNDRLIPLINHITDQPLKFNLVLDDYHLIHNQDVHNALAFLLDNLPPPLHLVITSRADPPLPLAALRARGQLSEIRAAQLGFSAEECTKLLNQIQALDLPRASIQTLIERTDGWIAAIQMVSIALAGKSDLPGYIEGVGGNQNYIADFLTTEVIQGQPPDLQDFLLKTSILDHLSGPLCDAVTGRTESQILLKQLQESNLFILPLDDRSEWFRYHHLFADLLQQRLIQDQAEVVPGLLLKACRWFESQDMITEAVDYALRGGHLKRAAAILEQYAPAILARSEIISFITWADQLPGPILLEHESLCIYYAWAKLVSSGESHRTEKLVAELELKNDQLQGRLNAVKSMLALSQKRIQDAVALSRLALDQIPEEDHFFRQIAAWNLSAMLFIKGDKQGGIKTLEEVARLGQASRNLLVAIISLTRLGTLAIQEGELERAEQYFNQARRVQPDDQTGPLPASCEAFLGLGQLAWERYELESARQYLEEGLKLRKRWHSMDNISSYLYLAHIQQSLGDEESANRYLQIARDNAALTAIKTDDDFVASQASHLALRQGNISAAGSWAARRDLESAAKSTDFTHKPISGVEIVLYYELIVFARYLVAAGRSGEALELLEKLLPPLKEIGHRVKEVEVQVLRALALDSVGKTGLALDILGELFSNPQTAGFKRVFVDEGPALASLIRIALDQGLESPAGREILEISRGKPPGQTRKEKPSSQVEPLSERELEILLLLRSELSVPDLAGKLFITVSTLRTHIKNIYRKLGVHSRFEAVSKAQDLDLI